MPPFVSYLLYQWDINVRMATIIGFAGGGGIGLTLMTYFGSLQYHKAGTVVAHDRDRRGADGLRQRQAAREPGVSHWIRTIDDCRSGGRRLAVQSRLRTRGRSNGIAPFFIEAVDGPRPGHIGSW